MLLLLRFQMPTMRTDQPRIDIRRAAIFVAGIITASCSEKPALDREKDANTPEPPRELVRESKRKLAKTKLRPDEDQIAEDCVAFVRSTKVVPARAATANCPGCPAGRDRRVSLPLHENGFGRLLWRYVHRGGDDSRGVQSGSGETIAGGLTAWIPPEKQAHI